MPKTIVSKETACVKFFSGEKERMKVKIIGSETSNICFETKGRKYGWKRPKRILHASKTSCITTVRRWFAKAPYCFSVNFSGQDITISLWPS